MRLAAFAALALFAAAHWVALVDSPPVGRMLLVRPGRDRTGAMLGRARLRGRAASGRPGAATVAAAVLAGMLGLALALGAAGLPLRLLEPRHWDELFDGLDRGLAGRADRRVALRRARTAGCG